MRKNCHHIWTIIITNLSVRSLPLPFEYQSLVLNQNEWILTFLKFSICPKYKKSAIDEWRSALQMNRTRDRWPEPTTPSNLNRFEAWNCLHPPRDYCQYHSDGSKNNNIAILFLLRHSWNPLAGVFHRTDIFYSDYDCIWRRFLVGFWIIRMLELDVWMSEANRSSYPIHYCQWIW